MLAQHQEHTSKKGGAGRGTRCGKAQGRRRGGSTDEGVPHRFAGRFSARLLEGRRTTLGWQNDPAWVFVYSSTHLQHILSNQVI